MSSPCGLNCQRRQVSKQQLLALVCLLALGLVRESEASGLRFIAELPDSVVVQHRPASFHCLAYNDGRSQIVVRWFIDSVEVRNSSEHFLFDNGTLSFPSIVASGSSVGGGRSMYRCRASDESGSIVSREAKVEFAYLTEYPTDARGQAQVFATNNTVYLECPTPLPSSVPDAEVSWRKDGVEFTEGLDLGSYVTSLQIPTATARLDGSYNCLFHNNLLGKSVTSPAVPLTIKPSRKILNFVTDNTEMEVTVGGAVLFQCVVSSPNPPSVVTWRKFEKGQLPSGRVQYIGSNLKIVDVQSEDAGEYECGAAGSAQYFKLAVDEIPIIQQFSPSSAHTVIIHHSFEARCTVYSNPAPSVYWTFNGVNVNQSEVTSLGVTTSTNASSDQKTVTARLKIVDVLKTNEGYYQCFTSNFVGDVYKNLYLTVVVPPVLLVVPQPLETLQGKDFTLHCTITGSPAPSLTWRLNDDDITSDSRRKVVITQLKDRTVGLLRVAKSSHQDTGLYVCHGGNTAASVSSSAVRVSVYVGAKIITTEDTSGKLHRPATLSVEYVGLPLPTVQWYFEQSTAITSGQKYNILDNGALKILDVEFSDVGRYEVEVSNTVAGERHLDRRQLSLRVLPIVSIQDPTVSKLGSSIILNCSVQANPPASVINWYKESSTVVASGNEGISISTTRDTESYMLTSHLLLSELREEDFGNYSCVAVSDVGESTPALTALQQDLSDVKAVVKHDDDGVSTVAIAVIVVVVLLVGVTAGVSVAVWLWRRRQQRELEKSMTSQAQLERVMRHSDQANTSFYASSGPHPTLELDLEDNRANDSVNSDADKDVSFSSFRRRQAGQNGPSSERRERVQGRRPAGFGRRSEGCESADLPPYSERDPLRSPTSLGGQGIQRRDPTTTAISTDVDAFSDQKRFSYRSTSNSVGNPNAEAPNQDTTDISTVV